MTEKKFNDRIDLIKMFLFLSFAFLLPISQKASTINIVLLLMVSLLTIKKDNNQFNKELVIPISLYLVYCVSLIYSSELQTNIISQKASLFAFPIIFLLNKNVKKHFKNILKNFILGCVISLVICEFNAIYRSFDLNSLYFNSRIEVNSTLLESITNEQNHFFSYNFSFIHQTVYFSMYLLFSIAVLIHLKVFKNKVIQSIILIFLSIGVFQILNKASFIVFFLIITSKLYQFLNNKKTFYILSIVLSIVFISIFIFNPRFETFNKNLILNRSEIKIEDYAKIKNRDPNRYNFRVMLWSSAWDIIKKNPITGIGAGGSDNRLYEVFAVKRQWYYEKEKYHAHNQYLQILMDTGILGFIPFTLMFVILIRKTFSLEKPKHQIIIMSFIFIIGVNFLFESMFERYSGISFVTFFYCLFVSKFDTNRFILKDKTLFRNEVPDL